MSFRIDQYPIYVEPYSWALIPSPGAEETK